MSLIEVKNLTFAYNGKKVAINDLSFKIEKGEYVSIVGHNGSGKSTLAKLIIGLLNKGSGDIIVDGLELNNKNVYQIRNKVALVFQNPDNQFIGATVEDDIAFGLENKCVPTKEMKTIIEEFSKEVGMEDYLKKEPSNLSGGQKQRVAIAGALALSPEIIILDEATSMLDPKGKKDIANLILKLKEKNKDLTVISITHDIEEAYNSDRVIVLSKGTLVLQGNPKEVLSNRLILNQLGLDIPFILDLKEKGRNININIQGDDLDKIAEEIWASK